VLPVRKYEKKDKPEDAPDLVYFSGYSRNTFVRVLTEKLKRWLT